MFPCVIAEYNMGTNSGEYELNHECACILFTNDFCNTLQLLTVLRYVGLGSSIWKLQGQCPK